MPSTRPGSDVFYAISEPARRAILSLLHRRQRFVGELVAALRLGQPSVSKHLGALRKAELVEAHREGRFIFYRLNSRALEPLRLWLKEFDGSG